MTDEEWNSLPDRVELCDYVHLDGKVDFLVSRIEASVAQFFQYAGPSYDEAIIAAEVLSREHGLEVYDWVGWPPVLREVPHG